MKYRKLGQSGIEVSVVGLGTWAMGGWMWGGLDDEADSISAIHSAVDAGVNLIDTAPGYGFGTSEKIIGKAIVGRRDKVVLATKCGLIWHEKKGNHFFDAEGFNIYRYLGADGIRYELEQSLKDLQTDYIDLYQTHWQDPTTDISETMETLLALKKEGKIRAIGVSNATLEEVDSYRKVGIVDSAQEQYSMLDRGIESTKLPYCRDNEISMLSYSSLAMGLLTGKIGPDRQFKGDDQRKDNPRYSIENRQNIANMLSEFESIAEKHKVTMAQLVIAWTVSQPGVTYALCGARNAQQALENAGSGDITLNTEELVLMKDAIDRHTSDLPDASYD